MPRPTKAATAAPSVPYLPSILSMDDIRKLSVKDACAKFAERAGVSQRAFAEMGKLHHAISAGLKKGQTIYGELRKLDVKDSTISNASYASRVWGELVNPGLLTEADYDGFTFADCLAICRATGKNSKRQISPEEVAVIVHSKPETFDAEFNSIYETGQTVEEAEAQAAAETARRAEEEAASTAAAAAKVEAEKQAAIASALESDRLAKEAAPAAPSAPSAPAAESTQSTPSSTASAESTPPVASATQEPETRNSEPETSAPVAAPSNIHPMPGAATAAPTAVADLPAVLSAIDEIGVLASDFSAEDKLAIMAKLQQVMDFLGENFTATAEAAA